MTDPSRSSCSPDGIIELRCVVFPNGGNREREDSCLSFPLNPPIHLNNSEFKGRCWYQHVDLEDKELAKSGNILDGLKTSRMEAPRVSVHGLTRDALGGS